MTDAFLPSPGVRHVFLASCLLPCLLSVGRQIGDQYQSRLFVSLGVYSSFKTENRIVFVLFLYICHELAIYRIRGTFVGVYVLGEIFGFKIIELTLEAAFL